MRKQLAVLCTVVAAFVAPAVAAADGPYSGPPDVNVDDPTAGPSQSITITLTGFLPGEPIDIVNSCGGTPSVVADGTGAATIVITAPSSARSCTITGTGRTTGRTDTAGFVVSLPPPMPPTGSDANGTLLFGLEAMVLGAGLVTVAAVRRRRTAAA